MEFIEQGRGWLEDGEPGEAVLEEATELFKAAGDDKKTKAAWLVVIAEAHVARAAADDGLDAAAEALAIFRSLELRALQAAAATTVAKAHILKQDWDDAVGALTQAVMAAHDIGDKRVEAAATFQLARAYIMQMKDPYTAAQVGIAATKLFRAVSDTHGEVQALQAVAEAHLLYDPEQALKVAKEAFALAEDVGDAKVKESVLQTLTAAKSQMATSQQASQAESQSGRGDSYIRHKWPVYAQQRGARVPDLFSVEEYRARQTETALATRGGPVAVPQPLHKVTFTRRSFKWASGRHATDEAWYRQELRFVPPKTPAS